MIINCFIYANYNLIVANVSLYVKNYFGIQTAGSTYDMFDGFTSASCEKFVWCLQNNRQNCANSKMIVKWPVNVNWNDYVFHFKYDISHCCWTANASKQVNVHGRPMGARQWRYLIFIINRLWKHQNVKHRNVYSPTTWMASRNVCCIQIVLWLFQLEINVAIHLFRRIEARKSCFSQKFKVKWKVLHSLRMQQKQINYGKYLKILL